MRGDGENGSFPLVYTFLKCQKQKLWRHIVYPAMQFWSFWMNKGWLGASHKKESCHITYDKTPFNSAFPCLWVISAHCGNWCWPLPEQFFGCAVPSFKCNVTQDGQIHPIPTHSGRVKWNKTWLLCGCWLPQNYRSDRLHSLIATKERKTSLNSKTNVNNEIAQLLSFCQNCFVHWGFPFSQVTLVSTRA